MAQIEETQMKYLLGVCLVVASLSACDTAKIDSETSAAKAITGYDARDFFMTTSFIAGSSNGLVFSRDGGNVLVNSDSSGVFNSYSIKIDNAMETALTQSTEQSIFGLSYFPEDDRLLLTYDEGGNELNHIYVRELDGSVIDLTPGDKLKAGFAGWKSDGKTFYISSTERDGKNFDLYAYDTSDYKRVLAFTNDLDLSIGAVSNDGNWLALVKPNSSADANIFLVNLTVADDSPKLITNHDGKVQHSVAGFSPDNRQLIYLTDEYGEFAQAWSYNLATGEKRLLAKADWDVRLVNYSTTGKFRLIGINADGTTELTILDNRTDTEIQLPTLPEGNISNIRFSRDDKKIALFINSDRSPSNLFVVDIANQFGAQLTNAQNPDIDPSALVEGEVIRYKSFDDLLIPAVLYKPKQASTDNKVAALVQVHGGPGGQSTRGYSAMYQHLVNHGYAVLRVNNRGSSGYGKSFYHMDDKRHGEEDLKDVVWGRKYLETLSWIDSDRIGIIGGSYGGFMVAAALTHHPMVFDVGIDIFGVTNWVRTLKSIPPWWTAARDRLYDELGDPSTDEERLKRISPLFHAENIVKPLMVIQGENDARVLKVESDELVKAVRDNGIPVEYVVFPDEGHGFRKRENRITASNGYVAFLDQYLSAKTPD